MGVPAPACVPWAPHLRLWVDPDAAASADPGRDLVLEPPNAHFADFAHGTLLDDLLDGESRQALDAESRAPLEAWRAARADVLTLDGIDLSWVWYVELLADVFLPDVRSVSGLQRVLGPEVERVELFRADADLANCLGTVLRRRGVDVLHSQPVATPTSYPRPRAAPWRIPVHQRLYRSLLAAAGLPSWVRGNVLVLPYWHLSGMYERMGRIDGLVPVADPAALPALEPRTLIRVLAKGGWVGRPNAVQIRRSARRLATAIASGRGQGYDWDDPLGELLDRRALRLIEQRAAPTLANVRCIERSLASRRVRGVLLSWDSPPIARTVLAAARRAGKPSVLVEHGFWAEPNDPDKTESDAAGVWSGVVCRELAPRARGRVVVTGNPGIPASPSLPNNGPAGQACTLVVPEYASRVSNWVHARVAPALVETALDALQRTRPGTLALLRPHPADYDSSGYATLRERFPALRMEVDVSSPIGEVISRADLCIGGVSTATLQAALAGVPILFLNVAGVARPYPFDASGTIPTAETADELAPLITEALVGQRQPERSVIEDALGVRPDAPERVLALLRETFDGSPGPSPHATSREERAAGCR
jgi:hypothetical protein